MPLSDAGARCRTAAHRLRLRRGPYRGFLRVRIRAWLHHCSRQVELLRSELDAQNFFSETKYLYGKDKERWKASFVRFCEDAVVTQQNEAVAQRLQNTAQSRYGDRHPEYLRARVRKENAVLLVWQTPVYEVLAGDWWHWTNESGGRKGATDVDCDVPCIVTDDTRLVEDADALFFEMCGLFFPKHRRKPEQLWVAIAWEVARELYHSRHSFVWLIGSSKYHIPFARECARHERIQLHGSILKGNGLPHAANI